MKIWSNDEVKSLFKTVEECKGKNNPLCNAFALHAERFLRKPNSVRNYYYKEVENLSADKARTEKLKIDLSKHEKTHFTCFEKGEEESLVKKIEEMKKLGASVREACKDLAGGDLAKMTRLQNKYQNLKRKSEKTDNVVVFHKKQKVLTDADLSGLVMGIVKLIKKNAVEELQQKHGEQIASKEIQLQKVLQDLEEESAKVLALKTEIERLKCGRKGRVCERDGKTAALKNHFKKKQKDAHFFLNGREEG